MQLPDVLPDQYSISVDELKELIDKIELALKEKLDFDRAIYLDDWLMEAIDRLAWLGIEYHG